MEKCEIFNQCNRPKARKLFVEFFGSLPKGVIFKEEICKKSLPDEKAREAYCPTLKMYNTENVPTEAFTP